MYLHAYVVGIKNKILNNLQRESNLIFYQRTSQFALLSRVNVECWIGRGFDKNYSLRYRKFFVDFS